MKFKRPTKSQTIAAERRTWESKCRNYRVIESHIPFAYDKWRRGIHLGYSDLYYATTLTASGWHIISKHRKRRAAERACENHEKDHCGVDQTHLSRPGGGPRRKAI